MADSVRVPSDLGKSRSGKEEERRELLPRRCLFLGAPDIISHHHKSGERCNDEREEETVCLMEKYERSKWSLSGRAEKNLGLGGWGLWAGSKLVKVFSSWIWKLN